MVSTFASHPLIGYKRCLLLTANRCTKFRAALLTILMWTFVINNRFINILDYLLISKQVFVSFGFLLQSNYSKLIISNAYLEICYPPPFLVKS